MFIPITTIIIMIIIIMIICISSSSSSSSSSNSSSSSSSSNSGIITIGSEEPIRPDMSVYISLNRNANTWVFANIVCILLREFHRCLSQHLFISPGKSATRLLDLRWEGGYSLSPWSRSGYFYCYCYCSITIIIITIIITISITIIITIIITSSSSSSSSSSDNTYY